MKQYLVPRTTISADSVIYCGQTLNNVNYYIDRAVVVHETKSISMIADLVEKVLQKRFGKRIVVVEPEDDNGFQLAVIGEYQSVTRRIGHVFSITTNHIHSTQIPEQLADAQSFAFCVCELINQHLHNIYSTQKEKLF